MHKFRILICGAGFGQIYLEALKRINSEFEVVGLFCKNSPHSQLIASYYNIPTYDDISQVPENINLVCVVVKSSVLGGEGTNLAIEFLSNGYNVMLEQPVNEKDILRCITIARSKNRIFWVGDLYSRLESVKKYKKYVGKILCNNQLSYIEVDFSSQVSYPLCDILIEVFPEYRPFKLEDRVEQVGPIQVVKGIISDIPIIFKVDNRADPKSPDTYLNVFHRIKATFDCGSLVLENTHGPIIWYPVMYITNGISNYHQFTKYNTPELYEDSVNLLWKSPYNSFSDIFRYQWTEALNNIFSMIKEYSEQKENDLNGKYQKFLLCAKYWNMVTKKIGYPQIKNNDNYTRFSVSEFDNIGGNYESDF